jgi:hypothetical protein
MHCTVSLGEIDPNTMGEQEYTDAQSSNHPQVIESKGK